MPNLIAKIQDYFLKLRDKLKKRAQLQKVLSRIYTEISMGNKGEAKKIINDFKGDSDDLQSLNKAYLEYEIKDIVSKFKKAIKEKNISIAENYIQELSIRKDDCKKEESILRNAKIAYYKEKIFKETKQDKAEELFSEIKSLLNQKQRLEIETRINPSLNSSLKFNTTPQKPKNSANKSDDKEVKFFIKALKTEINNGNLELAQNALQEISARADADIVAYYHKFFQENKSIIVKKQLTSLLNKKKYQEASAYFQKNQSNLSNREIDDFLNWIKNKKPTGVLKQISRKLKKLENSILDELKREIRILKSLFKSKEKLKSKEVQTEIKDEAETNNSKNINDIIGKEKDEQDILENIIKQKQIAEEKERIQEEKEAHERKMHKKLSDDKNPFLDITQKFRDFLVISLLIFIFSKVFFFIQFDEQNRVLGLVNKENLFVQEQEKEKELEEVNNEIEKIKEKLKGLNQGFLDIQEKVALREVMHEKIDWLAVKRDLDEATKEAFPYNDILNYISYNSFAGNAEKKSINITGNIVDPTGRVFKLTTELIQSINNHQSFSGAQINTFTKTENQDEEVGGFMTSFALSLTYKK